VGFGYAYLDKLLDVYLFGIEEIFAILLGGNGVRIGLKMHSDLAPYFVTASADGRTNADDEVGRVGAKRFTHNFERFVHDTLVSASPSGVYCPDGLAYAIVEENGHAIGRQDGQDDIGLVGHKCISLKRTLERIPSALAWLGDDLHMRPMHLKRRDKHCPFPKTLRHVCTIGQDICHILPSMKRKRSRQGLMWVLFCDTMGYIVLNAEPVKRMVTQSSLLFGYNTTKNLGKPMERSEIAEYFRKIPQNFNYILILQILPLLYLSSLLVKEIDPRLFQKQMIYYVVGTLSMVLAAFVPWSRILWWFAPISYILNTLMLLAVKFFGISILGARRWLAVPGTHFTIQPSEFIKISVVLMLAYLVGRYPPPENGYDIKGFAGLSLVILVPFYLIAKEPDLGTALVLLMTGYGILFLAGINWKLLMTLLVIIGISAPMVYQYGLRDYQKKRINDFLGKPSYHVRQALIAIGSGGLKGKSKDDSTQTQLKFLPIASSDFIFAYLGERFGFHGMLFVIVVYILLIVHLLILSHIYSDDYYVRAVSSGLAFLFFIYMGVNMYMIIGLAPVVGVPLPMFSHGGTSFIIFSIFLGILLNLIATKRYFVYNADSKITMIERNSSDRYYKTPPRRRRKKITFDDVKSGL